MVTKIKEWCLKYWMICFWVTALCAVITILGGMIMGYINHRATFHDQPKMSIAETEYSGYRLAFLKAEAFAGLKDRPFDPATMEITRIDTVGWAKLWRVIGIDTIQKIHSWTAISVDSNWVFEETVLVHKDIYGWVDSLTLDSTIVPKTSPLLTREENEKLKNLLGRQ